MTRTTLSLVLALLALFTVGCASRNNAGNTSSADEPAGCGPDAGSPPTTLWCTGLYQDIGAKTVSPNAQPYSPATPLWSDGATKSRWIEIPQGQTIDRSDPNEWVFPVGTKVWKEFSVGGQRIETRFFQKTLPTYWVYTTYVWNADESAAVQSFGESIPVAAAVNGTYVVPTPDDCNSCHKGRNDHLLGFEEVSLGLPAATGLTLSQLAANGQLSPPPPSTSLTIGDDGTGLAAPPLGWLHINCGTTCHNDNQNSMAYGSGLHLRLDPTQLDGRSAKTFEAYMTSVGVPASSPDFNGVDRIIPGDPTDSVLVQLITVRGPTDQMPPIGTRIVDQPDDALVEGWIAKMPHATTIADAGVPDAKDDAGDAKPDSSEPEDSGHTGTDSGAPKMDAATDAPSQEDTGTVGPDAGSGQADSGTTATDATVSTDAGAPPQADAASGDDASVARTDGGPVADAGAEDAQPD
jgi:hypothetical protein